MISFMFFQLKLAATDIQFNYYIHLLMKEGRGANPFFIKASVVDQSHFYFSGFRI